LLNKGAAKFRKSHIHEQKVTSKMFNPTSFIWSHVLLLKSLICFTCQSFVNSQFYFT